MWFALALPSAVFAALTSILAKVVITLILAFVFLREPFTWKSGLGAVLITIGPLVMAL